MKSKEINPDTLKRWHDVSDIRLTDVMGALSAGEVEMMMAKSAGQVISTALLNAFMLLRCIIGRIGEQGDELSKLVIINDEAGTYSFTIRVVDVYALTDSAPVVVVFYEHGPGSIFTRPSAADLIKEPSPGVHWQPGLNAASHLKATLRVQKLLNKILHMNAKRLSSSYAPPLRNNGARYKHNLSFLLPITPLSMREVGSLSSDVGCAVCGQPSSSRCASCQQAAYCSKDCQKADWATHKRECKNKSLASGNWTDVDILNPGYSEYTHPINEFSIDRKDLKMFKNETPIMKSAADWPPPNLSATTHS